MVKSINFSLNQENNKNIYKGIIITKTDDDVTIKLDNGYNVTFLNKNINIHKTIDLKENSNQNFKSTKSNIKADPKKPKIAIIHTGGTIASKVDYKTGGVATLFSPEELLNLFPELLDKANLEVFFLFNIFSEDFTFKEYNKLASKITELIFTNKYDGIIIGHGTDTLHYTSAALHYSFKNLPIPILLVGAQRSSDRPSSDAFSNLNAAIDIILKQKESKRGFYRVGAVMHSSISDNKFALFDALNLRKCHSTRRDAFKQINYNPVIELTYKKNNLQNMITLREELISSKESKKEFQTFFYNSELKIGFFKIHPNIDPKEITVLNYYDAIIIEGTGVGNIPLNKDNELKDGSIFKEFKKLIKNGTILIISTQTISGEISLDIYSRGREIQQLGFLGNRMNLTSETLFLRIAHILSRTSYDKTIATSVKKDVSKYWYSNLEFFKIRNIDIKSPFK